MIQKISRSIPDHHTLGVEIAFHGKTFNRIGQKLFADDSRNRVEPTSLIEISVLCFAGQEHYLNGMIDRQLTQRIDDHLTHSERTIEWVNNDPTDFRLGNLMQHQIPIVVAEPIEFAQNVEGMETALGYSKFPIRIFVPRVRSISLIVRTCLASSSPKLRTSRAAPSSRPSAFENRPRGMELRSV